jgi:hypothetical protein
LITLADVYNGRVLGDRIRRVTRRVVVIYLQACF